MSSASILALFRQSIHVPVWAGREALEQLCLLGLALVLSLALVLVLARLNGDADLELGTVGAALAYWSEPRSKAIPRLRG